MSGYEIASLTEIESMKAIGTLRWTPVRKHFGITAFGISAYTATEVGQDVIEEHTEERLGHESSTSSWPGERRCARRRGKGPDCGLDRLPARPEGEAFCTCRGAGHDGARDRWEARLARGVRLGVLLHRVRRRRRGSRACDRRDPGGAGGDPDHPALHFHLACIYCRAGRLDEAGVALDRALELDPKFQKWADEDEDLEPLRASDAINP